MGGSVRNKVSSAITHVVAKNVIGTNYKVQANDIVISTIVQINYSLRYMYVYMIHVYIVHVHVHVYMYMSFQKCFLPCCFLAFLKAHTCISVNNLFDLEHIFIMVRQSY